MEPSIIVFFIPVILLAFLAFGLFMFLNQRKIRARGIKTLAKVIKVEKIKQQQDVSFQYTVEYLNQKGESIVQVVDEHLAKAPKENIPFEIPIIYLENKKKTQIVLANNRALLIMGASIALFAILMLILFTVYALQEF